MKGQGFAPAVGGDFAFVGIQGDDDAPAGNGATESIEKVQIDSGGREDRAANDDLCGPAFKETPGARDRADSTADTDFHFVSAAGAFAERFDQCVVVAFVHGGVEVNDVQPRIGFEPIELREDIGDRDFASAAVNQLDGLAGL